MKERLGYIIAIFLAWLPVFAIQKPVFMLYNHAMADGVRFVDWLLVVWHGLKLDCTIAGYLTAFPLLCVLLSVWLHGPWLKRILRGYFLLMAILVAAIFAADVALYAYWGFRLDTTPLFYLKTPKDAMASVPLWTIVTQTILFAVYAYAIYWLFRRFILSWTPEKMVRKRLLGSLGVLILGGLMFIPIRGGVTTSTANVGMVYFSQNQYLNHSAINPCFSLLASLAKEQDFASQFDYFPEDERQRIFTSLFLPTDTVAEGGVELLNTQRPNILLILLESFSANAVEVVGGEAGVTPHLNRLSQEGVLFTNMYANSFRTDRGLVSILNGYPAQPTTSIMKYPAKSQTLPSIAHALDKVGYRSDMLYGGDINFTNMQSYFFGSGYSAITADRDFPLSSRLSKWGANDDITLQWLYESLKERPTDQPWMNTFLTLSSHEPFVVPYARLEDPYLNSVAFTDSCLGDFIDKTKQLPLWDNLLIVLVSDHGFRYPHNMQEYDPQRYHIPMLWIGGAVKEPAVVETLASQIDLPATLLKQLGLPTDDFAFSKDILNPASSQFAFYTFNNGFGFIDQSGKTVFDNEGGRIMLEDTPTAADIRLQKGKALLQTLYDDMDSR